MSCFLWIRLGKKFSKTKIADYKKILYHQWFENYLRYWESSQLLKTWFENIVCFPWFLATRALVIQPQRRQLFFSSSIFSSPSLQRMLSNSASAFSIISSRKSPLMMNVGISIMVTIVIVVTIIAMLILCI